MADNKEVVILDFQADTTDAVKNVANLTKANKDLKEEKKAVDTTTDAGIQKQKQLDDQIKNNTATVKDNMAAVDKVTKSNTSLKDSVDKVIPGLGSAVSGFFDMAKASLAFIATPIGAVIGALGIAIGALTAYFKSSEDAQNKWNKVLAVGSAVMEQLLNFVEDLGGMLVSLFEDPQKALEDFGEMIKENMINRFEGILNLIPSLGKSIELLFEGKFSEAGKVAFDAVAQVVSGVKNASDKIIEFGKKVGEATELGIKNGLEMARLNAKIDADERKLIVDRAKIDLEVSKLREKALHEEGEVKRATIQQAIELEKKLSDAETLHAKTKLDLAKLELKNNGDDKEAKMKVVQAEAALISAEAQRYQATLRFSKEIEKLDDAEAARKIKLADTIAKAQEKAQQEAYDEYNRILKAQTDAFDKQLAEDKKKKAEVADAEQIANNLKLDSAQKVYGGLSSLVSAFAGKSKATAKSMAVADAGLALTRIFSSPAAPFVEPFATITRIAEAAIIAGKTASAISQIDRAGGGASFLTNGPRLLMVGDNPGGVEHVNVTPISGKGTSYIDGQVVANSMTKGMGAPQMHQVTPNVYVSWKEFTEFKESIDTKKAIVTA